MIIIIFIILVIKIMGTKDESSTNSDSQSFLLLILF